MTTKSLPSHAAPVQLESASGTVRLLSQPQLKTLKGITYSVQWLNKLIKAGSFPRPIKLGLGPTASNFFLESEIDDHIEAKAAERHTRGGVDQ